MTWLKRALPAVALLLCVIASPSFAQIAGHPIEVSGGLGTVFYDTRARLQDRGAVVGSVGYRLAPWLVGEVGGLYSKSYADTTPNPKATFTLLSADLRFNLRPGESRVVPFLLAGLGYGASKRDDATPRSSGAARRASAPARCSTSWDASAGTRASRAATSCSRSATRSSSATTSR
jgi:hypothetical protein